MTDSKLLSEKPLNDAYHEKTVFSLSSSQYEKLSSFPVLYESLARFLEPFDSESPISEISVLLSHINSSFYEYIDGLQPDSI